MSAEAALQTALKWMAWLCILLIAGCLAMSFLSCAHAPVGRFDVAPLPDAGTTDLSWGMP